MDLPGSIREIRTVSETADGQKASSVVFKRKGGKKRKKASYGLRPVEEIAHQAARGRNAFSTEYLRQHEKSNQKRRDGWLLDLPNNVYKASRKARKQAKVERVLGF